MYGRKGEIYVLEGERMFRIHDVWQNRSSKMMDFLKEVHVLDIGKCCDVHMENSQRLSMYVVFHIEGVTYRMEQL